MSDAPIVTVTDTQIIYRASALGMCKRALYAARMRENPMSPPPALQRVFDQGHELEAGILYALAKDEGWVIDPDSEQRTLEISITETGGREVVVRGHVDAVGFNPLADDQTPMPIDAKAFSQSTLDKFLTEGINAFPHYAWQMSFYALAMDTESFCMPLWNKDENNLTVKVFHSLPYDQNDIFHRIAEIEVLAAESDRIPYDAVDCLGTWGCPFRYLHDEKEVGTLDERLAQQVEKYWALSNEIKTLETRKKDLAKLLIEILNKDDDLRHFKNAIYSVNLVSNPKRLNIKAIKELIVDAGLDINDYYTPGEGLSLRVKKAGE